MRKAAIVIPAGIRVVVLADRRSAQPYLSHVLLSSATAACMSEASATAAMTAAPAAPAAMTSRRLLALDAADCDYRQPHIPTYFFQFPRADWRCRITFTSCRKYRTHTKVVRVMQTHLHGFIVIPCRYAENHAFRQSTSNLASVSIAGADVNTLDSGSDGDSDAVIDDAGHPTGSGYAVNPVSHGCKHVVAHELVAELKNGAAAGNCGTSNIFMRPAQTRKFSGDYVYAQIYAFHGCEISTRRPARNDSSVKPASAS